MTICKRGAFLMHMSELFLIQPLLKVDEIWDRLTVSDSIAQPVNDDHLVLTLCVLHVLQLFTDSADLLLRIVVLRTLSL